MSYNEPKEVILMIHDVNGQYYLKILLWGSANLGVPIFGATFVTDNTNLEPTTQMFWTILTVNIMDHQEYFLGIILSHI